MTLHCLHYVPLVNPNSLDISIFIILLKIMENYNFNLFWAKLLTGMTPSDPCYMNIRYIRMVLKVLNLISEFYY